ncbi:MAG: hypothetical protein MUC87_11640 [Bacteroidia bacterium]|jgi:hypothetical protein|nr:hypothetical protein [Bacteroidia bacterium]
MPKDFESIRRRFRSALEKGTPGAAALEKLCDELGLLRTGSVFRMAPEISQAYAIASGAKPIEILISPQLLEENFDFGLLTRILAHELLHVEQRTRLFPMKDHDEREFLAYADTLLRKDLPPIAQRYVRVEFLKKGLSYYPRLSKWKQWWYRDVKAELERYGKTL